MALKDIRNRLSGAASAASGKVKAVGGTVAERAAGASVVVAERAKEGAQMAAEAQIEARKKKYAPVFREEYLAPDYDLPNMIVIEDEDKRKGIDVCEGAIGWLTRANGMEILHLYHEFVDESGLVFHPLPQMDAAYLLDVSGSGRFVNLECLFAETQKEKMAELQNVAYCLGAKYCRLETYESLEEESVVRRKGKASARKMGAVSASATGEVECGGTSLEERRMLFERDFSGSDKPVRPQLSWFKSSKEVNGLIDMRCSDSFDNEIREYTVEIDCRSVATLSHARATAIDAALKGLKISLGLSLKEESSRESRQKMSFSIKFQ